MRIHVLQHVNFEYPGTITEWAKANDYPVTYSFLFEEKIYWPALTDYDLLVIMGGPMSVHDTDSFKWLVAEKKIIHEAIVAGKPILGICLGAQLLAEALGGKVYANHEKEIGFFPVIKTNKGKEDDLFSHIPGRWNVFHWHGDTFDLPEGASLLFTSEACTNQVFRKENFIGIQFHPEIDTHLLNSMISHERDELVKSAYVQTEEEILQNSLQEREKTYLHDLLTKLVQQVSILTIK